MRIIAFVLMSALTILLMAGSPFYANAERPDERIIPESELPVSAETEQYAVPVNPSPESKQEGRVLDPNKPIVALTFDDGPTQTTLKILDLLEQHGGRGTFFMVGYMAEANPGIVKKVAEQGSEIGNHTWNHPSLTSLSAEGIRSQISSTNNAIYNATGVYPALLRPPYGNFNNTVTDIAAEYGLPVIYWSVDTRDWATRNANTTYNIIMNSVQDGSIMPTHDLHVETGVTMESVIPALVEEGYQLVTVSELLGRHGDVPTAGTVYYAGPKANVQDSIRFVANPGR